jgi:hypothetical protein
VLAHVLVGEPDPTSPGHAPAKNSAKKDAPLERAK